MAAAYAALVSLMNTVDAVRNHPRLFTSLDKYQAESLKEKLDSLLQFVVDYDFRGGKTKDAVEDLRSQIGSAAHAAEVVIEAHIVDRIITGPSFDLQNVVRGISYLIENFNCLSHGMAIEEEVEDLKTQIESVQGNITQGMTPEAAEGLKTRLVSLLHAAADLRGSLHDDVYMFGSCDLSLRHLYEETNFDLGKIGDFMSSLRKKVSYVKEQRKHEHYCDEEQSLDLQKIIVDMGSLMDKVNNVKEQMRHEDQTPTDSMSTAAPSRSYSADGKISIVGFEDYKYQLLVRLTGNRSERQVIPITGMGGIGKTTLARNVYDDLLIVHHFDKRAWATVSQEYSVRKILGEILSSVGESTVGLDEKSENELGEELYKILFARRYLIILDDMWSIDAWDKLHSFFPKQENGSRIVVSTRQSDLAKYFGTSTLILSFLDEDKSWQLFREKVFAYEDCPHELEGIGRKIVKKCRGLPLSIVVIGGLLGKSSRVQEYWEKVEKDMNSIVNLAEKNLCSDILSLSYYHLPIHLKPCFLYLGIFPEATEIPLTQLVRLWVAEGFLKPNKDQSLEEVGEGYVKDLEDRNLIVVQGESYHASKAFRICKVHDLLRELCIRTAEKEKFFCVMSVLDISRRRYREGHSVFHKIILLFPRPFDVRLRLLSLSIRCETQDQHCELWRVLFDCDYGFTDLACQQISLRYFENNIWSKMTASTPPLGWNMQTFERTSKPFRRVSLFEIWEMTQIRHVRARRILLSDPPSGDNHNRIVLENLQTLGIVVNFKCSEQICKRMPNIKELSIEYDSEFFDDEVVIGRSTLLNSISNVGCFNKLESLEYFFFGVPNRDELLQNLKFPNSLKKLRLQGCKLHWDDLTIIGSLPHLESLKLDYDAAQGPEWNPIENQFCCLKLLEVGSEDLINWNADSSHFPILEKVSLRTGKLNEIPQAIGEIPTLRYISMFYCGASIAISALKILKVQEDFGNNDIKVSVEDEKEILEKVREWAKLERISTDNVRFK